MIASSGWDLFMGWFGIAWAQVDSCSLNIQ
jgi:hypothetical protein